jgi:hypothetical protein
MQKKSEISDKLNESSPGELSGVHIGDKVLFDRPPVRRIKLADLPTDPNL